ncbi:MAG: hypothetical protein GY861_15720 [bacterium]|nr:hypothetical protein [bacterium]
MTTALVKQESTALVKHGYDNPEEVLPKAYVMVFPAKELEEIVGYTPSTLHALRRYGHITAASEDPWMYSLGTIMRYAMNKKNYRGRSPDVVGRVTAFIYSNHHA